MKIYIGRDDKQFGPYTREQLQTMLANGEVVPTDLAWHEGMEEWAPLSEIPEVIKAPKLPPIIAPPILASYKPDIGNSGKPSVQSSDQPEADPRQIFDPNNPTHVKIEAAIRGELNKPEGQLAPEDFREVRSLTLENDRLTDISPLKELTELEYLDLESDQLPDLSPLAGLSELTHLSISTDQLPDLSPLGGLTELTHLSLHIRGETSAFTDEHLKHLAGLTRLESFNVLGRGQLTDISPLAGLTRLRDLSLQESQLTDISPLAGLTRMWMLALDYNQLTDVSPLSGLTRLETLSLNGNPDLNDADIVQLQMALPKCDISPQTGKVSPQKPPEAESEPLVDPDESDLRAERERILRLIQTKETARAVKLIKSEEAEKQDTKRAAQEEETRVKPEPELATMDVVITGSGISTYNANKLLQELKPGVSYFDISKLLRDFPKVACENLPPEEAEAIKTRLEAAECMVELRVNGS